MTMKYHPDRNKNNKEEAERKNLKIYLMHIMY